MFSIALKSGVFAVTAKFLPFLEGRRSPAISHETEYKAGYGTGMFENNYFKIKPLYCILRFNV